MKNRILYFQTKKFFQKCWQTFHSTQNLILYKTVYLILTFVAKYNLQTLIKFPTYCSVYELLCSYIRKVTFRNDALRQPCNEQGFRNNVNWKIIKYRAFVPFFTWLSYQFWQSFRIVFTGPSYRFYWAIVTLKQLVWSLVRCCWQSLYWD